MNTGGYQLMEEDGSGADFFQEFETAEIINMWGFEQLTNIIYCTL